jgi:outer membrane lipoprotein SlyB
MPSDNSKISSNVSSHVSLPIRSTGAVPRAVWVGGALLSVVTAALAGALIMQSVNTPPALASTPTRSGTAVPLASLAAPVSPAAKPVHHHKPAASPSTAPQGEWSAPGGTTRAALCASCGIVESVSAVQQKGQGTGLGAVAGGVLGGVVGHQVGGGNGKTAMTVLGAIGGGMAGNEVEKRARSETRFNVQVRMEDGRTRSFQRSQSLAVGTHVLVDGSTLRVARDADNGGEPQPVRRISTSTGSGI